jgi:hypothetical protein
MPRHLRATSLDEGLHGAETRRRALLHATQPPTRRLDRCKNTTRGEPVARGIPIDAFNKENSTRRRRRHRGFTRNHRKKRQEVQHHNHAPNKAKRCQIAQPWPALAQTRARISPGAHLESTNARRVPERDGTLQHLPRREALVHQREEHQTTVAARWSAAGRTRPAHQRGPDQGPRPSERQHRQGLRPRTAEPEAWRLTSARAPGGTNTDQGRVAGQRSGRDGSAGVLAAVADRGG